MVEFIIQTIFTWRFSGCFRRLKITIQISLSSELALVACGFQGICSFHLTYLLYWHEIFVTFLYYPFNISKICTNGTSPPLDTRNLCHVFFFSWSLWLKVYQFYWYSQRTSFCLNWLLSVFYYTEFCSHYYILSCPYFGFNLLFFF